MEQYYILHFHKVFKYLKSLMARVLQGYYGTWLLCHSFGILRDGIFHSGIGIIQQIKKNYFLYVTMLDSSDLME